LRGECIELQTTRSLADSFAIEDEESPYVKRRTLTLPLALVVAIASATLAGAAVPTKSSPKATPTAKPDACSKMPSKWQRFQCEEYTHSAPGDRYFGRMKMSYLGINNTFRDAAVNAGASTTDNNIVHRIFFANDALRQWASLFPNDPQLARTYFLAFQVESKIYLEPQQKLAWQDSQTLIKKFPTTYFGKLMAVDLRKGFTEHWYAATPICPTPLPTAAPGVKVTATPSPTPSPSPTASPSPQPGQPKIDIITPPCVPAATPSPVPTPMPALTPAGASSASPIAPASAPPTAMPSARPTV